MLPSTTRETVSGQVSLVPSFLSRLYVRSNTSRPCGPQFVMFLLRGRAHGMALPSEGKGPDTHAVEIDPNVRWAVYLFKN